MDLQFLESECLTTVLLVVIMIIVFFWFVYPKMSCSAEKFSPVISATPEASVVSENVTLPNGVKVPYYDESKGVIMAGSEWSNPPQFDPMSDKPYVIPPGSYLLDDGQGGNSGLSNAKCSQSCCSQQWPVPFKLKYDSNTCNSQEEYRPSNLTCNNNYEDSGCLCITDKQFDYLSNRGGNA